MADEAYALGGETAAESYLNTEAILAAIERSGADAVHPGYGFFSENPDFARAITDARRRRSSGRPPEAMEIMGDKISSRLAAEGRAWPGCPGRSEPLTVARRGGRLRRGARLAGGHQGGLRRRRAGHEGRRSAPPRPPTPSSPPSARPRPTSAGPRSTSSAT